MKTKFWLPYLLIVFLLIGGGYFVLAGMSDVPLTLSESQMEELSGTLLDWDCIPIPPCDNIPCDNNTLEEQFGINWTKTCETDPNATCYWKEPAEYGWVCSQCTYYDECGGEISGCAHETWRECE